MPEELAVVPSPVKAFRKKLLASIKPKAIRVSPLDEIINARNIWYHATKPLSASQILLSNQIRPGFPAAGPRGVSLTRQPVIFQNQYSPVTFILDPEAEAMKRLKPRPIVELHPPEMEALRKGQIPTNRLHWFKTEHPADFLTPLSREGFFMPTVATPEARRRGSLLQNVVLSPMATMPEKLEAVRLLRRLGHQMAENYAAPAAEAITQAYQAARPESSASFLENLRRMIRKRAASPEIDSVFQGMPDEVVQELKKPQYRVMSPRFDFEVRTINKPIPVNKTVKGIIINLPAASYMPSSQVALSELGDVISLARRKNIPVLQFSDWQDLLTHRAARKLPGLSKEAQEYLRKRPERRKAKP